jgi:hypothetical protein
MAGIEELLDVSYSPFYRQFQLLNYARGEWREVRYHIADYGEKISIKTAETTEIFQYLQL